MESLASFNSKNRATYARCRGTIAKVDQMAARSSPEDAVHLRDYRDGLASGLHRKQVCDVASSAAFVSMEIGGLGFIPALFMGPTALYAAAGCLFGGLVVHVATIFAGRGYPDQGWLKSTPALHGGMLYAIKAKAEADEAKADAARQAAVMQRAKEFATTLHKATAKAGPGAIDEEGPTVVINGLTLGSAPLGPRAE